MFASREIQAPSTEWEVFSVSVQRTWDLPKHLWQGQNQQFSRVFHSRVICFSQPNHGGLDLATKYIPKMGKCNKEVNEECSSNYLNFRLN